MSIFRTFRSRLSAIIAFVFGTMFVLLVAVLYLMMHRMMYSDLDRSLRTMAKIDLGAVISDDSFSLNFLNLRTDAMEKNVHLRCEKCHTDGKFNKKDDMQRYFQIMDAAGSMICTSHEEIEQVLSAVSFAEVLQSGRPVVRNDSISGSSVRVISWPMGTEGRVEYVVQIGTTTAVIKATLQGLLGMLGVLGVVGLLLTAYVSNILSRSALAPVDDIIRKVEMIGSGDVGERLQSRGSADEIGRLVMVFNSMLERLQKSMDCMRRFTSDVSHEIRSPLTILRGDIEVALRRERAVEDYKRVLASNLEEIRRMSKLCEDLLTLARTDYGDLQLDIKQVNLAELLDEVVSSYALLAEQKGIAVSMDGSRDVLIHGDRDRLREVFANIVENAIVYTPEKGRVNVGLGFVDREAKVIVSDTGPGIPPDHLPYIFDRFYRVDPARSRCYGGTGLGLSISKEIAEAHMGRIEVQSKVGEGSVFTVYLPLEPPAKAEA